MLLAAVRAEPEVVEPPELRDYTARTGRLLAHAAE
jgi:hypothetical protein